MKSESEFEAEMHQRIIAKVGEFDRQLIEAYGSTPTPVQQTAFVFTLIAALYVTMDMDAEIEAERDPATVFKRMVEKIRAEKASKTP